MKKVKLIIMTCSVVLFLSVQLYGAWSECMCNHYQGIVYKGTDWHNSSESHTSTRSSSWFFGWKHSYDVDPKVDCHEW